MPSIFYNYLTKLPSLTVYAPPQEIISSDGVECIDTSILRTYRFLEDSIALITESISRRLFSIESILSDELIKLTTRRLRTDVVSGSDLLISPKYYSRLDNTTSIERIIYRELSRPDTSSAIDRISLRRFILSEYLELFDIVTSPPTSFVFSDEYYTIYEIIYTKEMKSIRDILNTHEIISRELTIVELASTIERLNKIMHLIEIIEYLEIANPLRYVIESILCEDYISQRYFANYKDTVYTLDVFGNVTFIRQDQIYYLIELKSIVSSNIVYDILNANEYFTYSRMFSLDYLYPYEMISSRFIELFELITTSTISFISLSLFDYYLFNELSNLIVKSFEDAIFEEVITSRGFRQLDMSIFTELIEYSYRVYLDEVISSDGLIFEYVNDMLIVKGKPIFDGIIALTTQYLNECVIGSEAKTVIHGLVNNVNESPIIDNEILTTIVSNSMYTTINRYGELSSSNATIKDYVMQKTTFVRGEEINVKFKPIFFANIELLPYSISNIQTNPYKFVKDTVSVSDNVISLEA